MGCSIGKLLGRGNSGGKVDKNLAIPEPPPPAPPDPRLPLTARQKFSMTKSWKGIVRAMEPTGIHMFLGLFEDHGELLSLFGKFRELDTRSQQAESLELAEHATVVMNSIDEGIRAMDNVDFFFDLLREIGASHRRIPGFRSEYFWKIENSFLEAVKLTLDERYTENIENIYKITIKIIIETVIKGFDDAPPRDNEPTEVKSPENLSPGSEAMVNDTIHNIKSTATASYNASRPASCKGVDSSQNSIQTEAKQQHKNNNNKNS